MTEHSVAKQPDHRLLFRRSTGEGELLSCYQKFRNEFPDTFTGAYLAADTNESKKRMSEEDPSIRPSKGVKVFHIDKGVRSFDGKQNYDYNDALDGMIDNWAEILALVDSLCLIIIESMMDFLAYYIRGEQHCAVFLHDCNETNVQNPYHSYAAEHNHDVPNFGLPTR